MTGASCMSTHRARTDQHVEHTRTLTHIRARAQSFLERWNNKFQKDLTLLASKVDDDDSKIMVFFPTNDLEAKTRKLSVDKDSKERVRLVFMTWCAAEGIPHCFGVAAGGG